MQVFKLCFKILKKNLSQMMIYIVIFLGISLMMSGVAMSDQEKDTSFTLEKTNIAFISEETSPLIDGLRNELGKIANFIELPDETEALQDALYFRTISYILRIPEGFTEKFMNGENVNLEKIIVPNSYSNAFIDINIDKYLNTARLYTKQLEGITQEELVSKVSSDLAIDAVVEMQKTERKIFNNSYSTYYFNYLAYSLMSVVILGMSAMILVFNDPDLKRRNLCSPISSSKTNLQFIMANLLFTFITWLIMVIFCFIFNAKNIFTPNTVYFILTSFVFAACTASISFLIGNLVKSRDAVPAISNVVTLGSCFLSGVFVPQELMGESVLKIASFTPTYWYVKANNQIAQLNQFDFSHLQPVLYNILILIGFALAFFALALVLGKRKRFS